MPETETNPWHAMKTESVMHELDTKPTGLTDYEARIRLSKYGSNEIAEAKKKSALQSFADQFRSILIIILLIAVIVSAFVGEVIEALVILAIVIINAILGFIQERKAEKAMAALKKLSAPNTMVIRNKETKMISSLELVPGDIIVLKAGDKVPADARILNEISLKVDESMLTGESVPIAKHEKTLSAKLQLADRVNMLFAGTTIVNGHCKAIVTSTAIHTEFGKIATELQKPEEKTPMQHTLDILGMQLGIIFVILCAIVFGLGMMAGMEFFTILLIAISLAVAAVPEGLPAAVTISLALGVQRMSKENTIVRKLSSVETLGCTTVICTDKTGTLTKNEMTIKNLYVDGRIISITGTGFDTKGRFLLENRQINPEKSPDLKLLIAAGMLCNDAIHEIDEKGSIKTMGDPTEIALLVSAKKAHLKDFRQDFQRLEELEFDSDRKMMSVVYEIGKKRIMYTKGAVENVLKKCSNIYEHGKIREITKEDIARITTVNKQFSENALRVIAFAVKSLKKEKLSEKSMTFIGLQAMIDPPRDEAREALDLCKKAGIKVIMITGDHKVTATAIAKDLCIITNENPDVLSGEDIDQMDDNDFESIVDNVSVYARVSPEHKLRICRALIKKGHVIAMTGDGINDAPALKAADIGIALGSGTDVAREASDMILTDDNFSTIVTAVKEGRGIYDNIKETLMFLLSGNIAELMIIFAIMIMNLAMFSNTLPLPLIAIQILWINLVMDGLPALAIAADPIEKDVMERTPRPRNQTLFHDSQRFLVYFPIIMTILVLMLFFWSFLSFGDAIKAQTMVFTAVIIFRKFTAFNCLDMNKNMIKNIFRNKFLNIVTIITLALLFAILYIPTLNSIFGTTPLNAFEWLLIIVVSAVGFVYLEAAKWFRTKKHSNKAELGNNER